MPLIVSALAAYVAGLFAGFADSIVLIAAMMVAAGALGLRRSRAIGLGCAALAVAGFVAARQSALAEERCSYAARGASSLTLVVDDSVAPGAYVHAHDANCDARAALSVVSGTVEPGSTVVASGVIAPSQRGVVIRNATVRLIHGPSLLVRWRAAAGRAIDRTFRDDAPLVRALLIADRRDLSPEVRDQFAAAGLAHILAIAGLHIGIIATAIALALEVVGVPRRRAAIVTVVVIVLYVAIIGAPVPAVRSACMLTALFATRVAQRPTSRWAIVALGALQPVVDPRAALDVGYQLSVVGVAAMIAASLLGKRLGVHRLRAPLNWVAVTILGTTIATIGTAPIVAWVFGRVSIVAPLSNLAAGPLIALAQPMVFCGMVLSPIQPLARLFADAAHPLLVGLTTVAAYGAAAPSGSLQATPTIAAATVGGVVSLAVIVACASKDWIGPAAIAVAGTAVLIWLPFAPARAGMVEVHMLDVGQGDAIALRTVHGHWILFDAGGAWRGGDAGRSTIVPYIGRKGGVLEAFILSHPHTDHVGGATTVIETLHPGVYVDAGFPGPSIAYRSSLQAAQRSHVRWTRAHPGDSLTIDGVSLTFLAPDSAWTAGLDDPNLASVVTMVRIGDVRMLFMGDAERPEEEWLLRRDSAALRADLLKVGHHGSKTSSNETFLRAVEPKVALVSVGRGNIYHLPTPSVMSALAAHGAQVLRTDRLGTIVARTNGQRLFIEAAGDAWEVPLTSTLPLRAP